jgi:NAD(P)-dependent dehydrogenase (short-subunit alcohol dehydrogenase family)
MMHARDRNRELTGKRIVITGGGSGIGLATARRMALEGGRVVIFDKDREALNRLQVEQDIFAGCPS